MGISDLERKRVEDFPLPMLLSVLWLNAFALECVASFRAWGQTKAEGPPRPAKQRGCSSQLFCPLSFEGPYFCFFFKDPIRKRKLYITVKI